MILFGIWMMCLTILGSIIGLFLRVILLLEDVEVGINAVIGDWLSAQQLIQVVPLSLQSIVLVIASGDDGDESIDYLQALLFHFTINFDKANNNITFILTQPIQMFASLFDVSSMVQNYTIIEDPQVVSHVSSMLAMLGKTKAPGDIQHLSNLVKQTQPRQHTHYQPRQQLPISSISLSSNAPKDYQLRKFSLDTQKLQWAGYSLQQEEVALIDNHLATVAEKYQVKEIRFWGKILGFELDYYVLQGVAGEVISLQTTAKGAEKRGEGVNYYSFWVANNLIAPEWIELPLITPEHIRTARKIKRYFTGHLDSPVNSEPYFNGLEKHYLKAQLVRMTHSLQLVPKGILKPNDDNPKIVEYEEEPKVPEFAQLATLQSWAHRNQNVLNLGRCTHYIDPSLPEDQIEAATAELAEKDPEVERLRGITEDKLPEGSPFGVENIWQLRVVGDSQVFQKDQASSVYGIVVLKNIYWPGWVTVGYKSGFSNFYLGNGHKWTQPGWSNYQNVSLAEEAEDVNEYHEPNPKEQPKPVIEAVAEQAPPEE